MSIERQTLAALKWSAGGRIAAQGVTWLITLAVIRLLEPSDYGLMALVAVVLSIGTHLADFGLGQALVQAPALDNETRSKLAGLVIVLHLSLGVLVALSAPLVAWATDEPRLGRLVVVASLQFGCLALGAVQQALAMRALDFKRLARIDFVNATGSGLVTLALAVSGAGVWSLVLGNIAGALLRGVLLLASGERVRPSFSFSGIGERIAYGSRLAAGQLSWLVVNQSDVLIGARMMTATALGAYSVGLHLATLPMQKLMAIVNQVGFSALARMQDDLERFRHRLLLAARLLAAVGIPVLWGLSSVAPEVVALALGSKWTVATVPLQLASLVVPMRMVSALFGTAVAAIGRAGTDLRNTIVITIVWPCSFAVGAHWDATGLAAAWLVAIPLTFALNFPRTSRVLGLRFRTVAKALSMPVLAGLLMYAAVAAVRAMLADAPIWLRAGALIFTGAVVYLGAITVLDRAVWSELRRVFSRRGT
jgi:O-antigen/teichoic acid export membrane protein